MFVCGPTVYDYPHIGHAKTYLQFDIIARYLEYKGYTLFYLMNITDIDNKIIKRANERESTPAQLAKQFTDEFYKDMKSIGMNTVDKYAKATDFIPQIISQIKRLMKKGYAYETSDGVYYDISKFKEYGKLSGQKLKNIRAGARVIINEDKKHPADFALWKKAKPGEPRWKSPFGYGRPGWHIEDTAITEHFFGPQYDIHGGARDLIFPHHEAEIAQIEAASGKKPLVKYWMHTGFLNVEGQKMSKSLGNFIIIKDALRKWSPDEMRILFAGVHYRSPMDFSKKSMNQAKKNLDKLKNTIETIKFQMKHPAKKSNKVFVNKIEKHKKDFIKNMDNDFNTPKALASLFMFISDIHKYTGKASKSNLKKALDTLLELSSIFGLFQKKEVKKLSKKLADLIKKRENARKNKDWKLSDKIRIQLRKEGIEIQDTSEGTKWRWL